MSSDRVEFSPEALAELEELTTYFAERNPAVAERVIADVVAASERLALHAPRLDGPPAVLRTGEPCRRYFVHPMMLYYDRAPGVVVVLHVWHHAREPIAR